jgi:hypothetical protein
MQRFLCLLSEVQVRESWNSNFVFSATLLTLQWQVADSLATLATPAFIGFLLKDMWTLIELN